MDDALRAKPLPREVETRLRKWHRWFMRGIWLRNILGVTGVATATTAAVNVATWHVSQVCAVVSALCMAALGFIRPEREYQKFIGAWRRLDHACNLYRYGFIDLESLFDRMADCERLIERFELEQDVSSTRPSKGKAKESSTSVEG